MPKTWTLALLAATALACAKPVPPPAGADAAIDLDGAHDKLEGEQYLHYAVGTTIAAPPEIVWQVLTDASAFPTWNSTVVSLDGTIADGETIALVSTVDPDRTFELLVTLWPDQAGMVWSDGNKMFGGRRTFTLTAGDGGTDFTMKEAFTGTMLDKIAPKLPDFGPGFDAFAADLKAEAERLAPAPAPALAPAPAPAPAPGPDLDDGEEAPSVSATAAGGKAPAVEGVADETSTATPTTSAP